MCESIIRAYEITAPNTAMDMRKSPSKMRVSPKLSIAGAIVAHVGTFLRLVREKIGGISRSRDMEYTSREYPYMMEKKDATSPVRAAQLIA